MPPDFFAIFSLFLTKNDIDWYCTTRTTDQTRRARHFERGLQAFVSGRIEFTSSSEHPAAARAASPGLPTSIEVGQREVLHRLLQSASASW